MHFGLVKFPQKHTHTYTRLTPQPLKDDDKTNQSRALGQLNSVTTSSSATSSRSKQRPIREKESAGARETQHTAVHGQHCAHAFLPCELVEY